MVNLIELCHFLAYKEHFSTSVHDMVYLSNVCSANVYIRVGNLTVKELMYDFIITSLMTSLPLGYP